MTTGRDAARDLLGGDIHPAVRAYRDLADLADWLDQAIAREEAMNTEFVAKAQSLSQRRYEGLSLGWLSSDYAALSNVLSVLADQAVERIRLLEGAKKSVERDLEYLGGRRLR